MIWPSYNKKGSHGSGDDSERLTPFVIWGSGIKDANKYGKEHIIDFSSILNLNFWNFKKIKIETIY